MAENNSSAPLLPCPFCGASAAVQNESPADNSGGYFVECKSCGASTNLRYACGDNPVPLLVEQWNARAPQAVAAQAAPVAPDANRLRAEILEHASKASRLVRTLFNEPTGTLSDVEVGDWIQRAQQYLSLATPALPATEDSSAGDLPEVVPWDGKLSDQLQRAINDLHIECKPAVVRHLDFAIRSEITALHTSLATVKRMYAAARDRLEAIDAAQPDPFASNSQAEVQAEPVGYVDADGFLVVTTGDYIPTGAKLYTAPQAQPADALDADRFSDHLPMQPVIQSADTGVYRFKENRIVTKLVSHSESTGYSLNEIARDFNQGMYSADEQMQLAQLIGYSVDGYGTLSYVTDESYERAAAMAAAQEGGNASAGKDGAA